MKILLAMFALAGLASAQQSLSPIAFTFGLNYNSARIAQNNAMGIPTPPFPYVCVFIAGNVRDSGGYLAVASWTDASGVQQRSLPVTCPVSAVPYDGYGDVVTPCMISGVDAPNGISVSIYTLSPPVVTQVP